MHVPPNLSNPAQLLTHAERLAREQPGGRLGLVFQGVTSVCLGIMTAKLVLDTVRDASRPERARGGDHNC
jgi:hypothetical protein